MELPIIIERLGSLGFGFLPMFLIDCNTGSTYLSQNSEIRKFHAEILPSLDKLFRKFSSECKACTASPRTQILHCVLFRLTFGDGDALVGCFLIGNIYNFFTSKVLPSLVLKLVR